MCTELSLDKACAVQQPNHSFLLTQLGFLGLMVMGTIATHCMLILVETSQELCRRWAKLVMIVRAVLQAIMVL